MHGPEHAWHSPQRKHCPEPHTHEPFWHVRVSPAPHEVPLGRGFPPVHALVPPEHW